jgi:HEAT repeat protein
MTARVCRCAFAIAAVLLADRATVADSHLVIEVAPPTDPAPPAPPQPASRPAGATAVPWFASLDAAYLHAQQFRQPMLVFVGSDAVAASRQAWSVVASSDAVRPWTTVRLDADADRDAARSLGVVTVPTLVALTPDGRTVGRVERPLTDRDLSAWLDAQRARATATSAGDDAPSIVALAQRIGDADPTAREAAVRLLRDQPATAAGPVVEALAGGGQQQRLSAADLLDDWHAPGIADVDPWSPATLTPARLAALRSWARSAKAVTPATRSASAADELDALAAAPTAIAARAVRERLLRLGPALLPQVVARLRANPPDPARGRLVALRYRLVATDRLAADWPGGFDRVASADAQVRRQAASDLVAVARAEDAPLLTELFADDDPFVREQSLKALRTVGGADTNRALLRLLADPEANVRAAVLNTLADAPDADLGGDLARYAAAEPDVDLVVHAVHVLELTPGADSFSALVSLLDHRQWRVRGEAAEALRGRLTGNESGSATDDQKTAAYAALEKRLDDPEGYVVTRAAGTLIKSGLGTSVGPLMAVAQRRQDVARDVLKALANDPNVARPFVPRIRELLHSDHAGVRSAAVGALAELDPGNCGPDVAAAMADPDATVRAAGVRAVESCISSMERIVGRDGEWFEKFRKGEGRAAWLGEAAPALDRAMRTAVDPATRVDAAVVLCALDRDDAAWPVLAAAAARPADAATVAPALPWLPRDRRLSLFRAACAAGGRSALPALLESLTIVPDDGVADAVWDLLGPAATASDLGTVLPALNKIYTGSEYGFSNEKPPPDRLRAAIDLCKAKASGGTELQRTAAMAVLLLTSPTDAAAAAQAVGDDPRATDWLRIDALQIRLLAQPQEGDDAGVPIAIAALNDAAHPSLRKVALPYLAAGGEAITRLRGSAYLYGVTTRSITSYTVGDGQVIVVKPPDGLKADPLRAVLATPGVDADLAGYAGYLLVLLGDRSGLDPLLAAARGYTMESPWDQLVYRAIATANDASRVPVLEEIFNAMMKRNNYQVRDFYWTIRSMTGPAVLKLRKRIRDEYGMTRLQ